MLPIDMARLAAEGARSFRLRQLRDGVTDHIVPMLLKPLRRGNGVGERDRAREPEGRSVSGRPVLRVLQRAPAPDDLGGVGDVDLAAARRQMRLQRGVDMLLGHGEHHDPVVGEQVLLDGPGEGQAIKLRPVD